MKQNAMMVVWAMLSVLSVCAAQVTADFTQTTAKFRPALHSSGYSALYERAHSAKWDAYVKEMNFEYTRTHDHALINNGARVFDTHFIFPLQHLDARDPKNYYFKPTDFMMKLQQDLGLKIFFRLGTSIEHTGLVHFNAEIPTDFDKMAEVFAGTIRHYNNGWADGLQNACQYWEIWNEPDGSNNMWSFNGGVNDYDPKNNRNAERRELFVKFFVKVLKRLKGEFPELKIGGPALCTMREDWFRPILQACKAEGIAPDFLSWHYYGNDPDRMFQMADQAQKMCEEEGFPKLEFIINEWHYVCKAGWGRNAATRAPDNMNDINSACFTLTTLSRLQTSRYDQAYFYGCRHYGNWGYRDYNTGELNKNFYALKAFGEIKRDCTEICASTSSDKAVTAFAAKSVDGKKGKLLVTDLFGHDSTISVQVKGVAPAKNVQAVVLSFEKNLESVPVSVKNGTFTLRKPDAYSSAFLITFDL